MRGEGQLKFSSSCFHQMQSAWITCCPLSHTGSLSAWASARTAHSHQTLWLELCPRKHTPSPTPLRNQQPLWAGARRKPPPPTQHHTQLSALCCSQPGREARTIYSQNNDFSLPPRTTSSFVQRHSTSKVKPSSFNTLWPQKRCFCHPAAPHTPGHCQGRQTSQALCTLHFCAGRAAAHFSLSPVHPEAGGAASLPSRDSSASRLMAKWAPDAEVRPVELQANFLKNGEKKKGGKEEREKKKRRVGILRGKVCEFSKSGLSCSGDSAPFGASTPAAVWKSSSTSTETLTSLASSCWLCISISLVSRKGGVLLVTARQQGMRKQAQGAKKSFGKEQPWLWLQQLADRQGPANHDSHI